MINFEPIISFAGNANKAIELYEKAFGAVVKEKILFSQANPKDYVASDDEKDLVYYGLFKIGKQAISFGDNSEAAKNPVPVTGNMLAMDLLVHFDTDEELKKAYEILSEGANITAPLMSQTYCSLTCALIDKFGMRWQFMSGYKG